MLERGVGGSGFVSRSMRRRGKWAFEDDFARERLGRGVHSSSIASVMLDEDEEDRMWRAPDVSIEGRRCVRPVRSTEDEDDRRVVLDAVDNDGVGVDCNSRARSSLLLGRWSKSFVPCD